MSTYAMAQFAFLCGLTPLLPAKPNLGVEVEIRSNFQHRTPKGRDPRAVLDKDLSSLSDWGLMRAGMVASPLR